MKKILVIGGSYFVGRVFNILASRSGEYEITVLNRGRYDLKLDNVSQIHCDRHDYPMIRGIVPADTFDAIVDFCAYEPGDIRDFTSAMLTRTRQYLFVSTASVYDPYAPAPVAETAPLATHFGADENSQYVYKKLLLENEVREAAQKGGFAWTILRPAFIFGPFNYAPREPMYFQNLLKNVPIPQPRDATGRFSFIYVKDIAAILMAAIGNERAYNEVFNLAGPEQMTYESFLAELEKAHGSKIDTTPLTVEQVRAQQIPLPFPLDYDEVFDGSKVTRLLGVHFTPFSSAFKETYDIYMRAMGG